MACCAAAIFVICQIIYALRRALALLTFGLVAESPSSATAANANARWVLGQPRPPVPALSVAEQFKRPVVQLGLAAAAVGVLISAGFWSATKPESGTALAGIGPMADVHQLICGSVTDPRLQESIRRDLWLRLYGRTSQAAVRP